jgi:hypothetical protein
MWRRSVSVEPLEPAAEPGAQLDHGVVRVVGEELPGPGVHGGSAQHGTEQAGSAVELGEVVVDTRHDLCRLLVAQHTAGFARFDRPPVQRDDQGLLDRVQP